MRGSKAQGPGQDARGALATCPITCVCMYSMCMGMLHAHRPPLTRGQVRCCSDNTPPEKVTQNSRWLQEGFLAGSWPENSGWRKVNRVNCSVWAGSRSDADWECAGKDAPGGLKTFAQAEAICKTAGARLCTDAELEAGCTVGSGCALDVELIWGVRTPSPPPAPPVD